MKPLLTVAEVAELFQCSAQNVYNLVSRGELRAIRVGAGKCGLRFSEELIEEFLRERETKPPSVKPTPPPSRPQPRRRLTLD